MSLQIRCPGCRVAIDSFDHSTSYTENGDANGRSSLADIQRRQSEEYDELADALRLDIEEHTGGDINYDTNSTEYSCTECGYNLDEEYIIAGLASADTIYDGLVSPPEVVTDTPIANAVMSDAPDIVSKEDHTVHSIADQISSGQLHLAAAHESLQQLDKDLWLILPLNETSLDLILGLNPNVFDKQLLISVRWAINRANNVKNGITFALNLAKLEVLVIAENGVSFYQLMHLEGTLFMVAFRQGMNKWNALNKETTNKINVSRQTLINLTVRDMTPKEESDEVIVPRNYLVDNLVANEIPETIDGVVTCSHCERQVDLMREDIQINEVCPFCGDNLI